VNLNIRHFPDELGKRIKLEAFKAGVTIQEWVTNALRAAVGYFEPGKKVNPPVRAASGHDVKSCRVYRCGLCKAAGVKGKRGL